MTWRTSTSSSSFSDSGVWAVDSHSFCFSSSAVQCFYYSLIFPRGFTSLDSELRYVLHWFCWSLLELSGMEQHQPLLRGHPCNPCCKHLDTCIQYTQTFRMATALPLNSQQYGKRGTVHCWFNPGSKCFPSCSTLIISLRAHFSSLISFLSSLSCYTEKLQRNLGCNETTQ